MNETTMGEAGAVDEAKAIVPVTFDGDALTIVTTPDGEQWTALGRICAPFGLDVQAQWRKLETLDWARVAKIATPDSRGIPQATGCLHLRSVAGWLFTINAGKVAPEVREKLVRYQRDCADYLADRMYGPRRPVGAPPAHLALLQQAQATALDSGDIAAAGAIARTFGRIASGRAALPVARHGARPGAMPADEFKALVRRHGGAPTVGRIVGRSTISIYAYTAGRAPVPTCVAEALRAAPMPEATVAPAASAMTRDELGAMVRSSGLTNAEFFAAAGVSRSAMKRIFAGQSISEERAAAFKSVAENPPAVTSSPIETACTPTRFRELVDQIGGAHVAAQAIGVSRRTIQRMCSGYSSVSPFALAALTPAA